MDVDNVTAQVLYLELSVFCDVDRRYKYLCCLHHEVHDKVKPSKKKKSARRENIAGYIGVQWTELTNRE
jgi:hypothetical protein